MTKLKRVSVNGRHAAQNFAYNNVFEAMGESDR